MAFGFIKKIFSFGRKQVEEVPAEALPQEDAAQLPAPDAVVEPISQDVAEAVESVAAAEPEIAEPLAAPEEVTAAIPEPEPEPEPETVSEMTEMARSEESFAPDGVYQPTAETADNGLPYIETPEPLDESSEPEIGHPQPMPGAGDAAGELSETSLADEASGSDGAFGGEAEIVAEAIAEPIAEPEPPVLPEIVPEPEPPLVAAAIPVTEAGAKVYIGTMPEAPAAPEPEEKVSWFQRLKRGLSRSSKELSSSITGIFTKRKLDEETLQELEDVLIRADLGMETAMRITDTLSAGRFGKDVSDEEVRGVMRAEIEKVLGP
ncbi:MAG: signal recognition particle receptor subunit alpha, partial [Rhizobiaceae bacterium]